MDVAELKRRAGIITEGDEGHYFDHPDQPRVSPDGPIDSERMKTMIAKALMVYANGLENKATSFSVRARTPENAEKAQQLSARADEYEELARTIDSWFAG